MDIQLRGLVNAVRDNKIYISVVNQFQVEVDLVLPVRMFAQWDSVSEGDLLIYRIWQNDLVLDHSVSKVEPLVLDEDILTEIDDRCNKLFLD